MLMGLTRSSFVLFGRLSRFPPRRYMSPVAAAVSRLSDPPIPIAPTLPSQCHPSYAHLDSDVLPEGYERVKEKGYAVFTRPLEKSLRDKRDYRLVKLDNGLEVLCISDPRTDKSAAAVSVRVGHLSDPPDLPGLAHFCEHLLFMGSKKYPNEDQYDKFISSNSGVSNAYTSMDVTNYHFDVKPEAFVKALDIFAQFFISPLFDPSCTEREIRAVDSENQRNLTRDEWRRVQLERSLSSPNHVFWRFGTGNLDSLWNNPRKLGIDIRDELIKFHSRHYSANLMKAVVLGKEPLDELVDLVAKTFKPVSNQSLPPAYFPGTPLTSNELGKLIKMKSILDQRHLELIFPVPDQILYYATKPASFLSHFVGHEGKGSLYSYLRDKEYAISVGVSPETGVGFGFLKIYVQLTREGYDNYEEVVKAIFSYLKLLQSSSPSETTYRELESINNINFKFKDSRRPIDWTSLLVDEMQAPYPREWILSAHNIMRGFDPEAISKTMELLTIDNSRIILSAQDDILEIEDTKTEKWYGTQYSVVPYSDELVNACREPQLLKDLYLPGPNDFIPTKLEIVGEEAKVPKAKPAIIRQSDRQRVWYKLDDRWLIPKAGVRFRLLNPLSHADVYSNVKTQMFSLLLNDALQEESYDASISGMNFTLGSARNAFVIYVDGYNEKLPILLSAVLDKIKGFKADPSRFSVLRKQFIEDLDNIKYSMPLQLASWKFSYLITERDWSEELKIELLNKLTSEEVTEFGAQIFKNYFMEVFAHGNIHESDVLQMADSFQSKFEPEVYPLSEHTPPPALWPPQNTNRILAKPNEDPQNTNSGVTYFCFTGDENDMSMRARLLLFDQLVNQHAFHVLRTVQQLGYICGSGLVASGAAGFVVNVQGEREASFLHERIYEFVKSLGSYLEEMSDEEFEENRKSVIARRTEEFKGFSYEHSALWMPIMDSHYEFERRYRDADNLAKLTKDDVMDLYNTFIKENAPQQRKLTVHYTSLRLHPVQFEPLLEALKSRNLEVPEEMTKQIEDRPSMEEFKQRFTGEFLGKMKVAGNSEDYNNLVSILDNLTKHKFSAGEQVFTDEDELKATQVKGLPVPRNPEFDYSCTI